MSQTTIKLRITPAEGRSFVLRGYQALDQRMANRKAGEIVRAGAVEVDGQTVKVAAVNFLRVPASR